MSTDTDYVITIKGKDAALPKADADFIEDEAVFEVL